MLDFFRELLTFGCVEAHSTEATDALASCGSKNAAFSVAIDAVAFSIDDNREEGTLVGILWTKMGTVWCAVLPQCVER